LAQPLVLEVSPKMAENFSTKNQWKLFFENYYPNLQDHLYEQTGIIFPDLHVKINPHIKNPYQYKIMIHHVLYQWGKFFNNDQVIPLNNSQNNDQNQTYYGTPLVEEDESSSSEYVQFSPEMMLIRHLFRALKDNQSHFLGIQEVKLLVDELESFYPDLVNEVLPRYITLTKLTSILKRLAEEQIPITNLKLIFEILAQIQPDSKDIIYVVEEIRCGLKSQITQLFAKDDFSINAITLDYEVEDEVRSSIREQGDQMYLTMDPERISDLNQEIRSMLEDQKEDIVILTQRDIRRFVRKIISDIDQNLFVLSYQELRTINHKLRNTSNR
jgi:type III secretory pathway component EscV